jgi:hypothetical protein
VSRRAQPRSGDAVPAARAGADEAPPPRGGNGRLRGAVRDVAILAAVFAVAVGVAELAGAANLGVAFGVGQVAFAAALAVLLSRG